MCFDPAIVRLKEAGIMHTNISEANMMVLPTQNSQGILVGFEFAILDCHLAESKRVCSESTRASEDCGTTVESSRETAPPVIPDQVSGDVVTHHVATLPLSRCMDNPPVHRFQHELESFVWSFFFILSGFRRGQRVLNPYLEKWYTGDWKSIEQTKKGFLEGSDLTFAGRFAESLGVDPQPLTACSRLLSKMLLDSESEQLDAVRILSALQEARNAYAKNELTSNNSHNTLVHTSGFA
jgi:hypothetical protein